MSIDVPSWAAAVVAAVLGFVGAWAALRVTVSGLKEDVATLKNLVLSVTTLQAQRAGDAIELDRVRLGVHETRNRLQQLSDRVARLEAQGEGS